MGKKSLFLTYVLWLFVGWLGLHHFYLGRDFQAFIWWSTFGGVFGLGWLRDLWRVPDYVDDANEEASYIESFKQKVKRGTPQFNVSRFAGQMLVGYFYGFLIRIAVPEEIPIWATGLFVPFGIAVGVYLVGNIGRETGDFKTPLVVCYLSNAVLAFVLSQEPGIMYIALFGSIAFQQSRRYRVEKRQKRGLYKRFFVICFGGCLITGLWVSFLYHNASIITEDGETIKLRDAVSHFFNSPVWREFMDVVWQLYNEGQKQGWQNMYDEFVRAFDPTGEQNAYKVLNLTETATQEEIKKSYRKLAREWHPDKNPGNKEEAQIRFIEIQEAYEILSTIKAKRATRNQKKRNDYNDNTKFKRR